MMHSLHKFPSSPGAYALHLSLEQNYHIKIGRLGEYCFAAGEYIYLGSAQGPGGLSARLNRHISNHPEKPNHWHIDYLRRVSIIRNIFYLSWQNQRKQNKPMECVWSLSLIQSLQGVTPVKNFGASDCKSGCPSHLVFFPIVEEHNIDLFFDTIRQNLLEAMDIPDTELKYFRLQARYKI